MIYDFILCNVIYNDFIVYKMGVICDISSIFLFVGWLNVFFFFGDGYDSFKV